MAKKNALLDMARKNGLLDRVTNGGDIADTLLSTVKRKEISVPAALAAAGTVAAKGSNLLRSQGATKKTRRLPIQRWTDVAVPVEQAYESWTKFETFPKFMHRVLHVEEKGENAVAWEEKIWFSRRQWEGKITDRRENDRIAWKTTKGMSHRGLVTFHRLDERLTRVMVDLEFEPTGAIEKLASGLRFVKRAVQADLARFKAYVEMEDAKGIEYRPAA